MIAFHKALVAFNRQIQQNFIIMLSVRDEEGEPMNDNQLKMAVSSLRASIR